MSAMPSSGLVGVSTQTIFVSGRIAARTASESETFAGLYVQPPALGDPGEEPVRAAVRVVGDHHVVAGPADRPQQGVLGGQAAGEGQPDPAALQRGQALLERVPGRVAGAAVLVAQPGRADGVLGVRAGLVDRWDHRAGPGLRLLAGVDGERLEAVTHPADVSPPHPPAGRNPHQP